MAACMVAGMDELLELESTLIASGFEKGESHPSVAYGCSAMCAISAFAGVEHGKQSGYEDGRDLGRQKGRELGRELGMHRGRVDALLAVYDAHPQSCTERRAND